MAFPRDIFTLGLSGLSLNEILPLNPQQFEIAGSQEWHLVRGSLSSILRRSLLTFSLM